MTSFFAQSFEFFSDKPGSICAFLATTRPIFNSSIIPVTLNTQELWNALSEERHGVYLLYVFLLSDTLQFAPSMTLRSSFVTDSFFSHLLNTLIHKRRYFCRSLKHFKTNNFAALELICEHVPSLETLDYSITYRVSKAVRSLPLLTRLKVLILSGSQVAEEDLEHFASLTSLQKLSFRNNHDITGSSFKFWSKLKSLRVLELLGLSHVSDAGLRCLPELPSLVELSVTINLRVTDVGVVAAVTKQKHLRTLDLTGCYQVSSEALKGLREFPDLMDLDLSACSRINDNSLSVLASIEGSLRRLSLGGCRSVTDEGVKMIVDDMKDLVSLNLGGCSKITDTSLKVISGLQYLVELRIAYLPLLSDEGIHFLKNCPRLSNIFFGDKNYVITCSVTDLSLDVFSKMKCLTTLVLYQARTFTDNGIAKLADSKSLERFELYEANDVTNDGMVSLSKSQSLRKIKTERASRVTQAALRCFDGTKIHVEID